MGKVMRASRAFSQKLLQTSQHRPVTQPGPRVQREAGAAGPCEGTQGLGGGLISTPRRKSSSRCADQLWQGPTHFRVAPKRGRSRRPPVEISLPLSPAALPRRPSLAAWAWPAAGCREAEAGGRGGSSRATQLWGGDTCGEGTPALKSRRAAGLHARTHGSLGGCSGVPTAGARVCYWGPQTRGPSLAWMRVGQAPSPREEAEERDTAGAGPTGPGPSAPTASEGLERLRPGGPPVVPGRRRSLALGRERGLL